MPSQSSGLSPPNRVQATGDKSFTNWRGGAAAVARERACPRRLPIPDELLAAARGDRRASRTGWCRRSRTKPSCCSPATSHSRRRRGCTSSNSSPQPPRRPPRPSLAARFPAARRARARRCAARRATCQAASKKATIPLNEHVLTSARAQLAEAAGEHADARPASPAHPGRRTQAESRGTCPNAPTRCSAEGWNSRLRCVGYRRGPGAAGAMRASLQSDGVQARTRAGAEALLGLERGRRQSRPSPRGPPVPASGGRATDCASLAP